VQVPSAEETSFRFSLSLSIFHDIIASTILQQPPQLLQFHDALLQEADGKKPIIDLEATFGCQNWVLYGIAQIASLDAWKQQRKDEGNLDVMELVGRASTIKDALTAKLARLEVDSPAVFEEPRRPIGT
jgi:C6 transcription factor Pro1